MIAHHYFNASDNTAQYLADCIGRQEVTIDFYLEHMLDHPFWRWTSDEDQEVGLDPWRYHMDMPIEPEEAKAKGWRIFVQKNHLPTPPPSHPHENLV